MIDAASAPSSRVRIEACSAAIVDVGLDDRQRQHRLRNELDTDRAVLRVATGSRRGAAGRDRKVAAEAVAR